MLSFTLHRVGTQPTTVDEDSALGQPPRYPARKAVIVVRNQQDCDYIEGLALVSGKPVRVVIDSEPQYHTYCPPYPWVFIANS